MRYKSNFPPSLTVHRPTTLNDGLTCTEKTIEGRNTLVLRICFLNQECWAATVWENTYYFPEVVAAAVNSLKAIKEYCPERVPHPTLHGDLQKDQLFCIISRIQVGNRD